MGGAPPGEAEKGWAGLPAVELGTDAGAEGREGAPRLAWGHSEAVLAACGGPTLHMMPEVVLRRCMRGEWALVQQSVHEVLLEHAEGGKCVLKVDERLKGCDMHGGHVLCWTGTQVFVYTFDESSTTAERSPSQPSLLSQFPHTCAAAAIYGEQLFLCAPGRIEVSNFSGSVVATLPFADSEGHPITIHAAGDGKTAYLGAGTDRGFIKARAAHLLILAPSHASLNAAPPPSSTSLLTPTLDLTSTLAQAWDVSRREPRQLAAARKLGEVATARATSVAIAADGSRLAAALDVQVPPPSTTGSKPKPGAPPPPWTKDPSLYLFHVDSDIAVCYDFGASAGRYPSRFYFEQTDAKLIGVETRIAQLPPKPAASTAASSGAAGTSNGAAAASAAAPTAAASASTQPVEVTTLFCTPEGEVKLQNTVAVDADHSQLIAIRVPHLYYLSTPAVSGPYRGKPGGQAERESTRAGKENASTNVQKAAAAAEALPAAKGCRLRRETMRDFSGIEALNDETRKALVDFSYYLTVRHIGRHPRPTLTLIPTRTLTSAHHAMSVSALSGGQHG